MSAAGAVAFDTQEALIARAQAKDEAAFSELAANYQTAIVNYIYRTMGKRDTEDARDLAQDTFLKAWKHIDKTQPGLKFGPWLYRIAQRVCLDEIRHRKLVRFLPLGQPNSGSHSAGHNDPVALEIGRAMITAGPDEPEHEALDAEARAEVQAVLDRLAPKYRAALTLRDLQGLSGEEVAERLGVSYASMKSVLFRARIAFREAYRRRHPERVAAPEEREALPYGSGVSFRRSKVVNPWGATPYDPRTGDSIHLGYFPTSQAALAAVEAWRAQREEAA